MAGEWNTQKYDYLLQMKTEELEELLRADMASPENSDPDLLLHIMEVIAEREKDTINDKARTEKAWQDFQKIYNTPEGTGQTLYPAENTQTDNTPASLMGNYTASRRRIRHSFRRAVAIAAVVAAILVFMVPTALGYESFTQMIGQWTKEIFQFQSGAGSPQDSDNTDGPGQEEGKSREYASLQEALANYGISAASVPSTVPEGFELQSVKVSEHLDSGEREFFAYYLKDEITLAVAIIQYTGQQTFKYEKGDMPVEEYVSNGITYYLFINANQTTAAWYSDCLEGSIYGNVSLEDMKIIIDTIDVERS